MLATQPRRNRDDVQETRDVLFPRSTWAGIEAGTITVAFRRWRRPSAKAGARHRTAAGVVAIHSVQRIDLDQITEDDAHLEPGAVPRGAAGGPGRSVRRRPVPGHARRGARRCVGSRGSPLQGRRPAAEGARSHREPGEGLPALPAGTAGCSHSSRPRRRVTHRRSSGPRRPRGSSPRPRPGRTAPRRRRWPGGRTRARPRARAGPPRWCRGTGSRRRRRPRRPS